MTLLEIHPLAEIFPPMADEAFAALVADIRENGLREAIVLHEGKVLDGRNRYRACTEIGIEPITKPWDQRGDALDYVVSKNLHRRHLDESQRSMVSARIANLKDGEKKRKNQGTPFGVPSVSQPDAAKMMNVGHRSVQRAKTIIDKGIPELVAAVDMGKVSAWSAAEIAKEPEEKQREIVMRGEKAITAEAQLIRKTRKPHAGLTTHRIKADIWISFRDALDAIAGMPCATEVAEIVRAHDKAKITDARLAKAVQWIGDFERAWNDLNREKTAA